MKNLIAIALEFVVNRPTTFFEAASPMSMKRVIYPLFVIILSLLYTIIIYLRKMHLTTSSSDLSDVKTLSHDKLCGASGQYSVLEYFFPICH